MRNETLTALIVDDEELARDEIRRLLKAHPDVSIVAEAADAACAREAIQNLQPELVFLDVQMPEESGFDLLASIPSCPPSVIFTTAYDCHALRAFEVGALDYLLKPVDPGRLSRALERTRRAVSEAPSEPAMVLELEDGALRRFSPSDKIFVRSGDRCWFVPLTSIRGIESDGEGVKLWLADSEPFINRSLALIEQRFPDQLFFRANRSQLINLQAIQSIEPWFSHCLKLTLQGGKSVELSRRQTRLFRERSGL